MTVKPGSVSPAGLLYLYTLNFNIYMDKLTTMEDFKLVKPGSMIFEPTIADVRMWFFGGISPKAASPYIMLINAGNVGKMKSRHVGEKGVLFFLSEQSAYEAAVVLAEKRLEDFKKSLNKFFPPRYS